MRLLTASSLESEPSPMGVVSLNPKSLSLNGSATFLPNGIYFCKTRIGTGRSSKKSEAGFSLVELIAVVVILGILAITVYPRFSNQGFDEAAFAQEMATALRYAQRLAVNSRCPVRVRVDAANERLDLFYPDGTVAGACGPTPPTFNSNVTVPGVRGGAYAVVAEPGVDVTTGLALYFDALGAPVPGGGSVSVGSHTVTVDNVTGYVH